MEDSDGKQFQVKVQPKTKVSSLKVILEDQVGLDLEGCKLTYKQEELNDSKCLKDYNIFVGGIIRILSHDDQVSWCRHGITYMWHLQQQ